MKKPDNKVGICRHIRLRQETDKIFEQEAQKVGMPVATLIRMYIERCFSEKGLKYGR